MKKDFKKMRTRYWYGKSIKRPQEALAAFFDFVELERAQTYLADIITHADSEHTYQPDDAAQRMMKYYALQSLLATCHNILNSKAWQQQFDGLPLSGMEAEAAKILKDAATDTLNATFELYPLKEWRYNLNDILNYALSNYSDRLELNLTAIYIQLKSLLEAAAFINNCFKQTKVAPPKQVPSLE